MTESKDELRLEPGLNDRLQAYAGAEKIGLQEAFETALGLGLELCATETLRREDRIKALELRLHDVAQILQVIGPSVLAVLRLLVAWAAQEGFGVSEDELLAELLLGARSEWGLALAEQGVVPPLAPGQAHEA